jgi:hypothetical protein
MVPEGFSKIYDILFSAAGGGLGDSEQYCGFR